MLKQTLNLLGLFLISGAIALAQQPVPHDHDGDGQSDHAPGAHPAAPEELPDPNRYDDVLDAATFGQIPGMIEGRLMPLETRARVLLLQISGVSSWKYEMPDPKDLNKTKKVKRPAIDWFARVLMNPMETRHDEIFLINNPELSEALGQTHDGGRMRYSFIQLQKSFPKIQELVVAAGKKQEEEKELTAVEREVQNLDRSLQTYLGYTMAFMFSMEMPNLFPVRYESNRSYLQLPDKLHYSFLDLFTRTDLLFERVMANQSLLPKDMKEEDLELFMLTRELQQWSQEFSNIQQRNIQIGIVPVIAQDKLEWFTPWQVTAPHHKKQGMDYLLGVEEMAKAFRTKEQAAFNASTEKYMASIQNRIPAQSSILKKISLERQYNKQDFFYKSELFYGLGMLIALVVVGLRKNKMWWLPFACCLCAWLVQTYGICLRMYIMGRPPITNLYATFLFVSWAAILIGLILEYNSRRSLASLASCFTGLVLLLVSTVFAAQTGDTLAPLVAVLNSNFWLATHVIAINLGYVGVAFAGVLGGMYLFLRVLRKKSDQDLKSIYSWTTGVMAFGLLFSFLGTMLGGVWADQSWGRFWGWDPKENGALLVVIMAGIMVHLKMGNLVREIGYCVGAVIGMIIVIFAWIGVNLLGVGLHAYGFTENVENGYYMSMLAILVYAVGMGITAKVIDATEEREKEDRKAARQAARQAAQSAS